MTTNNTNQTPEEMLEEMRQLYRETKLLHQQIVENLTRRQAQGKRASQPQTCPNCGAPLQHHRAWSGQLVVCADCGWSEFIDRDGRISNVNTGGIPILHDMTTIPGSWTQF